MNGIHFPTSDIILVGIIILVVLVSICLEAVTLSQAIRNRKVMKGTQELVHKVMGTQLRITAMALKRLAEMSNDSYDIELAKRAEEVYREHCKC